jgi:predicted nucleic acid-binding protein
VKVVCNTSPLLLLAKIQRLALLPQLYTAILVPRAVLDELGVKPDQEATQIQALVASGTLTRQPVTLPSLATVPATLGRGEREAIALALETAADLVVLDDHQGRRVARTQGLAVTGTIGVLIEARARGLVPALRPELDRLRAAGLWLTAAWYQRLCQDEDAEAAQRDRPSP